MRRVLIQACLVATAAVQLSACCCNSPTPDRPPPPPPSNYPPPPPTYVPPQPPPQPQPQYVPPPQPYPQPPPQPYNPNPQPPPGYHPAAPIPNGYSQPPPPQNNYPPAQPSNPQGANDEALAGSEAQAWAAQHGMPGARVTRVRWENNVWKVMLRSPAGNTERRMHVYVLPSRGGVRSGVALAGPTVQGWGDDERP